jgi:hypothetical protein
VKRIAVEQHLANGSAKVDIPQGEQSEPVEFRYFHPHTGELFTRRDRQRSGEQAQKRQQSTRGQ